MVRPPARVSEDKERLAKVIFDEVVKRLSGIDDRKMKKYNLTIIKNKNGFSLIELLIVMIIMGLLASLVGPRMFGKLGMAKEKTARSQIALFITSLDSYRLDIGSYPTEEQGFHILYKNPGNIENWNGPYVAKEIPLDPWNKAYIYKNPGENGEIDIISLGADGKEGGDGENSDIGSWQ